MTRKTKERKTETITVRVTKTDKIRIMENANRLGMSVSDYLISTEAKNSAYIGKFRRSRLNTILMNTLYKADVCITELQNSEEDQVSTKVVIDRLSDIIEEVDSLCHR